MILSVYDGTKHQGFNLPDLKQLMKKIKLNQRQLSRKVKGSHNRNKQRVKLAKLYAKKENKMNDKQKELLEDIQLKTIDLMIKDKNLNVLAIIKDCKDKSLFFDEFYEVIFVKLVTQFEINDFVKISIRYENFNLNPLKASQLMNESIKYSGQEFTSYCNFQNIDFVMKSLHENTLYLDDYNMKNMFHNDLKFKVMLTNKH